MNHRILRGEAKWRLCFVEGNIMYFTDDITKVSCDDWDDSPCCYNASIYDDHNGHLRMIGFDYGNGYRSNADKFSADDLNNGAAAWLYSEAAGGLYGGASIFEAEDWLQRNECAYDELLLRTEDFDENV